ncbi:nucleoside triphosphate pyrophosphatase [Demequina sp. NBRC 110057]|uniref:Maf family protein n=1 Tax=Demequina sp. NBRC 110057 TaxID=1570346 RepID=UPI000A0383F9|nr:Maf family protein [Demequina sp. NBRC 110057]
MTVPLLLASQSPARLATLRSAGIVPEVLVSGVDEDAVLAGLRALHTEQGWGEPDPADAVLALARAKAEHIAAEYDTDAIILGCDSMLEIDGAIHGKPRDAETARERWRAMRGRTGVLHTGHWLVDDREDGSRGSLGASSATTVRFADLTDDEIDAYVATGEPLNVAGGFTVDGLGGPYVEGIDGDFHGVVGVSLPLLRHLLAEIGVPIHALRA